MASYLASGGSNSKASAGLAGLALSYAPGMTDTLNNLLRNFTTLETMMVRRMIMICVSPIDTSQHGLTTLETMTV